MVKILNDTLFFNLHSSSKFLYDILVPRIEHATLP